MQTDKPYSKIYVFAGVLGLMVASAYILSTTRGYSIQVLSYIFYLSCIVSDQYLNVN